MNKNVGKTDRILRVFLGLAIAAAGVYFNNWFGLIAIIPLATAFMGWCPAYAPFGACTIANKKAE